MRSFEEADILLVDESFLNITVRINPTIAQERPAATNLFDTGRIDLANYDLLTFRICFGNNDAERIAKESTSPKLDSRGVRNRNFMSNAIYSGDVNAIRDGVRSLDRSPRFTLL